MPSDREIEAAAREAFWTDDLGGHIKGRWTWETIPEEGRENYRKMVRAVLSAAATARPDPTPGEEAAILEGMSFARQAEKWEAIARELYEAVTALDLSDSYNLDGVSVRAVLVCSRPKGRWVALRNAAMAFERASLGEGEGGR